MGRVTPDAQPAARLGVLGGTFDPPHNAHLRLAEAAQRALRLDRVLLIPAGDPWRKSKRAVSPAADRLRMVELAAAGHDWLTACDLETRRAGPTYTAETLEALRDQDSSAIWFVLGADALEDLSHWHQPARLIQLARFAVVARPGHAPAPKLLEAWLPGLTAVVDWVPMEPMDVSASGIRARVAAGQPIDEFVPSRVRQYIAERGLYRDDAARPA